MMLACGIVTGVLACLGIAFVLLGVAISGVFACWPHHFRATPADYQVARAMRRLGGLSLSVAGALYGLLLVFPFS